MPPARDRSDPPKTRNPTLEAPRGTGDATTTEENTPHAILLPPTTTASSAAGLNYRATSGTTHQANPSQDPIGTTPRGASGWALISHLPVLLLDLLLSHSLYPLPPFLFSFYQHNKRQVPTSLHTRLE
ncbi:hypothetical protein CC2G_012139 [Coprinopsis cinerea AmutBmut pab1-1]|nr:hypothetical protein CC2G_012139 [Coprinopsis cinerea AmutBmut pab1-1]